MVAARGLLTIAFILTRDRTILANKRSPTNTLPGMADASGIYLTSKATKRRPWLLTSMLIETINGTLLLEKQQRSVRIYFARSLPVAASNQNIGCLKVKSLPKFQWGLHLAGVQYIRWE